MPVKTAIDLAKATAAVQNAVESQGRPPENIRQARRNANMLIGRDAGSTQMASTSALLCELSDETRLRSDARMEKVKKARISPA